MICPSSSEGSGHWQLMPPAAREIRKQVVSQLTSHLRKARLWLCLVMVLSKISKAFSFLKPFVCDERTISLCHRKGEEETLFPEILLVMLGVSGSEVDPSSLFLLKSKESD